MVQGTNKRLSIWSDALPLNERNIVDKFYNQVTALNWRQRRDVIETALEAGAADWEGQSTSVDPSPHPITNATVAAIIERLDTPAIVENDQTHLFAISANLDHQAAACDWFIETAATSILSSALPQSSEGLPLH